LRGGGRIDRRALANRRFELNRDHQSAVKALIKSTVRTESGLSIGRSDLTPKAIRTSDQILSDPASDALLLLPSYISSGHVRLRSGGAGRSCSKMGSGAGHFCMGKLEKWRGSASRGVSRTARSVDLVKFDPPATVDPPTRPRPRRRRPTSLSPPPIAPYTPCTAYTHLPNNVAHLAATLQSRPRRRRPRSVVLPVAQFQWHPPRWAPCRMRELRGLAAAESPARGFYHGTMLKSDPAVLSSNGRSGDPTARLLSPHGRSGDPTADSYDPTPQNFSRAARARGGEGMTAEQEGEGRGGWRPGAGGGPPNAAPQLDPGVALPVAATQRHPTAGRNGHPPRSPRNLLDCGGTSSTVHPPSLTSIGQELRPWRRRPCRWVVTQRHPTGTQRQVEMATPPDHHETCWTAGARRRQCILRV
jgi:hypothetical protein